MIYSCLATLSVVATYGQLAENVALNDAPRCNNYIRVGYDKLYPVGTCYSENTDANQVDVTSGPSSNINGYTQNMQWTCRATDDGVEACEQRMDLGCNDPVYTDESSCRPCNGADDQCECTLVGGGDDCSFYEITLYDVAFAFGSGWYCNKKTPTYERTVVNMCIQGDSTTPNAFTYAYVCGGYDRRSRNDQPYVGDIVYHTTTDCSDTAVAVPTSAPTETTLAPTEDTGAYPWCSETLCDGVTGPAADGVDRNSVVVALVFAVFASLL